MKTTHFILFENVLLGDINHWELPQRAIKYWAGLIMAADSRPNVSSRNYEFNEYIINKLHDIFKTVANRM